MENYLYQTTRNGGSSDQIGSLIIGRWNRAKVKEKEGNSSL